MREEERVWGHAPTPAELRGLVMDAGTARDSYGHQYDRMDRSRYGACRCDCCGELFSGEGYRAPIPDGVGRRWLYVCLDHERGDTPPWRQVAAGIDLDEVEEPEGVPG